MQCISEKEQLETGLAKRRTPTGHVVDDDLRVVYEEFELLALA
jgi:hypothetical protein